MLVMVLIMSAYIVYEHVADPRAISLEKQIERHEMWMAGNSEFYNPWQYRVFSPLLLEGASRIFHKISGLDSKSIPFLFIHFLQMVIMFYLSMAYYRLLGVENPFLLISGLVILCYSVASSTFKSDLSFNTYFDIIFYLLAAILVLKKHYLWIVPVTLAAALNRETSGFIPLMMLVPFSLDQSKRKLTFAAISMLLYVVVFFSVRYHFGFQESQGIHGMTSPSDFLVYNFSFFKLYPLLIGTLCIIPLIFILNLSKVPTQLLWWFWLMVPFWFIIHFLKSTVVETRLFLVPQLLIFLPGFLLLAERWHHGKPGT